MILKMIMKNYLSQLEKPSVFFRLFYLYQINKNG